jgi:hypothetical protein
MRGGEQVSVEYDKGDAEAVGNLQRGCRDWLERFPHLKVNIKQFARMAGCVAHLL